jgi:hypothetical protein
MISAITSFFVGACLFIGLCQQPEPTVGADPFVFTSTQLAASPSNGDCLTTNGTDNAWGNCGGAGSIDGSGIANTIAVWTDADTLTATSGNPLYATRFTATSTAASSTLPRIVVSTAVDFFGTFANSLDDLCVAITGGSGLCDGNDASGAGGGSGTVSTSTGETGDQVAFWTTTAGTPALLGSDAGLSYSSTTDRLTTINASTTRLTALQEAKFGGSATSTFSSAGVLTLASNLFMPASSKIDFGGGDVTVTDGGGNNLAIDGGTLTVTNGDIKLGTNGRTLELQTAGISLVSDNDGQLTVTSLGNGSNENLTLNLDDTANTAVWNTGTGVTTIDWSALNLTTTGTITSGGFFSNSWSGFGTTTPHWALQIASSTRPQLALSDGTNTSNHWTMRNAGGILYIATSSPVTFATSTPSALTLQPGATALGIGTTTFAGMLGIGPITPNASTTIGVGKWQIDGYNSAGTRSCTFLVGTTMTTVAGACN